MQLSTGRIALLSAVLVLLAVLCAAGGTLVLINGLGSGARQQAAEGHARLLAARVASQVAHYKTTAQQLALHVAKLGLLQEGKTAERAFFAGNYAPALPQVLKLRLLPTGTRATDASIPELGYVCLDLLNRSEKGQAVPDIELHLPNTPSAHLDVLAPVTDATAAKRVLGHVLLSLDPATVRAALAALKPEDGYAELRQVTSADVALVVASGGEASLKSGEAPVAQDIAGSHWRLAYWPAAASQSSSIAPLVLPVIALLLALVLLGSSVVLPMLWLSNALRQDNKTFRTLFNDIRTGVLGQYQFRLQEFSSLAQQLRSSGEELIHDRQEQEKKAQHDNLTGLASRAAFDTKLKQLHQQAHGGLASALLIAEIDNFEAIKAQLGPRACDALLKLFARQLREALRQTDLAARLENGKFALLFPFTDLDKVQPIADRLRARLAEEFDPGNGTPKAFSWSAGLTLIAQPDANAEASFARAGVALQQAVAHGGNRTITQAPPA